MAPTLGKASYSRSAYSAILKGKRASSYLEGVSPRGIIAGIAPGGRVIMSGGTTGLGILEQALACMPVLVSTWEVGPPIDIDCKLYQVPG